MKKSLSVFLLLFLFSLSLANEKSTSLKLDNSALLCYDLYFSANNVTDQLKLAVYA